MARREVGRAGLWALLDNASSYLFAFIFFVMSARILGPQTFGIGVLVLSLVQILTPLVESLFHDALIQREDLSAAHRKAATAATLAWAAVLVLLGWAGAPSLARLMNAPQIAVYLPWTLISLLFSALSAVPAAEARRAFNFRILAIRSAVGRGVGLAIGLVLLFEGFGVWAMVAQQVAATAFACVALLAGGARLSLQGPFRWESLNQLLGFALPAVGTQLLVFGNTRIVTLIIGGAFGASAAGFWNVSFRFVEPVQVLLATTLGQLALPMASRRQGSREAVGELWFNASRLMALISAPILLGMAVCSPQILHIFVGATWAPAEPYMRIVCIVITLLMLRQMVETSMSAIGQPRLNFMLQAFGTLVALLGVALGVRAGLLGAAIGWSLRLAPVYMVGVPLVSRLLNISAARQFGAVAPPLIAAVIMALTVAGLQTQMHAWAAWQSLSASVGIGTLTYALVVTLTDRNLVRELRALARRENPAAKETF